MKIALFGTPAYVVPVFEKLARHFEIAAIVTAAPMPTGREKTVEFSEVDHWAFKKYQKRIPVFFDPNKVTSVVASMAVVASYGQIISEKVIDHFPQGVLNIHPSLLPVWRGAAPVQASIISNEGVGLSVIKMDAQMDHGAIISQFKDSVQDGETADELRDRLFERSADFLIDLIPNYLNERIQLKEQNHDEASFTKQLTRQDGFVEPEFFVKQEGTMKIEFIKDYEMEVNAINLDRFIRAMREWPSAWTLVRLSKNGQTKRLKILKAHVEGDELILDEVQLEGKNPVTWEEFKRGYFEFEFKK